MSSAVGVAVLFFSLLRCCRVLLGNVASAEHLNTAVKVSFDLTELLVRFTASSRRKPIPFF